VANDDDGNGDNLLDDLVMVVDGWGRKA